MSRLLPHKVERGDIPEYCWFSIRELITNAVCHRDYDYILNPTYKGDIRGHKYRLCGL